MLYYVPLLSQLCQTLNILKKLNQKSVVDFRFSWSSVFGANVQVTWGNCPFRANVLEHLSWGKSPWGKCRSINQNQLCLKKLECIQVVLNTQDIVCRLQIGLSCNFLNIMHTMAHKAVYIKPNRLSLQISHQEKTRRTLYSRFIYHRFDIYYR